MGTLDNTSTERRTTRRRTATVQAETNTESTPAPVSAFSSEPAPVIAAASEFAQTQSRAGRKKTVEDVPNQTYFDFAYDSDDGENNS